MKKILNLVILIFILCSGCELKKGKEESTPLAEVNGEILTLESFRSLYTEEQWNNLSEAQKRKEIENWVNLTVLAQEADREKISEEKATKLRIDYALKKVKANALLAQRLANLTISEEEMFNYYRLHQADFNRKLMEYNIQRILCSDENTAKALLNRIKSGEYDFNQAALENSLEELKYKQGRMGFVSANGPDSLFWKAAQKLEINEPGIVTVNNKTYIIRSTEQREGKQEATFVDYRKEIYDLLLKDKKQQLYNDLVRELKMKNNNIYYYY
ncbi:MAG: peptidylprolyl isomerase [Candidatus Cloacimonadaceae bacterium]|jgi:hypothetical protein|nr:peptidylprolyl isomerase [Candidatus Cloacimonadota bacterium]MCB5258118.1 peptidylprolyl isomerase [Candidatus Cloacimonadota bacterium]MDD5625206.1 peptidylprolyl isomerase [Candidatus Cloacimonadota bacterium]MDY0111618.1 peptidylprolyl isomerase [Candidatus Syntrophosphaera sp.]